MTKYDLILLDLKKVDEKLTEYTAHNGNKCYRTFGNLDYYFLLCDRYDLNPKWTGDFLHEANEDNFGLDYCEHDIILWRH